MTKLFASEAAQEIAWDALRIHGGNGFTEEYGFLDLYNGARLLKFDNLAAVCLNPNHDHLPGIYSTEAPPVPFETLDAVSLQQTIDAQPKAPVAENFSGQITVESYTVAFGRSGPERGIVVGRNAAGERVLANSTDATTINQLLQQDPLGRAGRVTQATEFNRFEFQ